MIEVVEPYVNRSFLRQPHREDPTVLQAIDMGRVGGQPSTQEQIDIYSDLRRRNSVPDSDQVVWDRVLGLTGGPVGVFRAAHPNIDFFKSSGELDEVVGKFLKEKELSMTAT